MLKLSYILPVYNGAPYITRCLNTILAQSLPESQYEIVCVNDCSPDNSAEIISEFQQTHKNIILVNHTENKRQGGAKNTGIRAAKGEYIVFIDQDDTIGNNDTSEIYNKVQAENLDIAAFKFSVELQPDNWREKGTLDAESAVMTGREYCEKYAKPEISLAPWSYWYRREYLLKLNRWFAEKVKWEDADWVAQAVFFAEKIKFFPAVIYRWVYNAASISHTVDYMLIADMMQMGWRKYCFAREIEKISPPFSQKLKKDGLHNGDDIKYIWKLNSKNIKLFYERTGKICTDENFTGAMSFKNRFLLHNKNFVLFFITVISPFVKFMRFVKKTIFM